MSRFRLLAAVAVSLATVGAVLVTTPSSVARESARPQAGQCRNLTVAAMNRWSNDSPTVACSSPHTTLTFAVPRLPNGVTFRGMPQAKMSEWARRLCTTPYWKKVSPVHSLRDRSLYNFAYFVPTAAERAAGARWVRCDLMLFSNRVLQPLPAASANTPVLSGSVPETVMQCLKKPRRAVFAVSCDKPHDMTPYATFFFKQRRHPTPKEFVAAGERRCPDGVFWTWPGELWWSMGNHIVVCYRQAA